MKFVLPRIGVDQIRITQDWSIRVEPEERNKSLFTLNGFECNGYGVRHPAFDMAIKAGTLMTVDRYYIRKGGARFDSITFVIHEMDGVKLKKKLRFWVNLDIAQTLEFEYA